jgi:hypothetical protein
MKNILKLAAALTALVTLSATTAFASSSQTDSRNPNPKMCYHNGIGYICDSITLGSLETPSKIDPPKPPVLTCTYFNGIKTVCWISETPKPKNP